MATKPTKTTKAAKTTKATAKATPAAAAVCGTQTFRFTAPKASVVLLAGDFTSWQNQPIPMQRNADGTWAAIVSLQPGTYHYRFIVDGEWLNDPDCGLRAPTPFGSENSVCVVS